MTTNSDTIASLARPVASGATGSHGQAIQSTANNPSIATPSVVAIIRQGRGRPTAKPLEVERQAGDERNQRRGDAVDDLKLARHRLGDDVAEIRTNQQAEQQIAGQPRQPEAAQELADDHCDDEREAERERRRRRRGAARADAPHPQHREDDEGDAEQTLHASTSGLGTMSACSSEITDPSTTTANAVRAASRSGFACSTFRTIAIPTAPGATR